GHLRALGDGGGVDDTLRAHGGNGLAGDDHADEVERVGGVHDDALTVALHLADPGQLVGGVRQRVLLAAEPGDEAAAAYEAPVLEAPQRPLELAAWPPQPDLPWPVPAHAASPATPTPASRRR